MKRNVILIGMPASGKSTLGELLAKHLGMTFLDTDDLIRQREGRSLQDILDQDGMEGFLQQEEDAVLSLRTENAVVATGGSVVYSSRAMEHLKARGICVYLQLPLAAIQARLLDLDSRGVAIAQDQSLTELYRERVPLYETWADYTFPVPAEPASPRHHAAQLAENVTQWLTGHPAG